MKDDSLSARIMAALPNGRRPVSTTWMARKLDCPRGYVYRRLEALREAGAVTRRYGSGKYYYERDIPGDVCENHPSREAVGFTKDDVPLCFECGPDPWGAAATPDPDHA